MLEYQYNPCICVGSSTPVTPACSEECVCLKVCNMIVAEADQVGPCGQTGTVDVASAASHDFCACGENDIIWSLESFDDTLLANASVTTAGVFTWITGPPPDSYLDVAQAVLKVCCGKLSAYTILNIPIKDECGCPNCPGLSCEECNPCTGLCADTLPNITVELT